MQPTLQLHQRPVPLRPGDRAIPVVRLQIAATTSDDLRPDNNDPVNALAVAIDPCPAEKRGNRHRYRSERDNCDNAATGPDSDELERAHVGPPLVSASVSAATRTLAASPHSARCTHLSCSESSCSAL